MLRAECPRCGETYFGWALENPENQTCECGNRLEVLEAKGKDIYKKVREERDDEKEDK